MSETVLLLGITGRTGGIIAKALLDDGRFKVAGLVRPESLTKPEVKELQDKGVDIRAGDLSKDDVEKLTSTLQGVDILISTVMPFQTDQHDILRAAKAAGVKRVVPSDFGPTAPRGVMKLHDQKLDIRQFVKDLGLPYTFIEVGWWFQLLPPPPPTAPPGHTDLFKNFIADGEKKVAYTLLKNIGNFVTRIVSDPRTLNQTVFAWDGEVSLKEVWDGASKISGNDFSGYPRVSAEEVIEKSKSSDIITALGHQYLLSLHVRGDNTVAKAVEAGELDARVLYPDYKPPVFDEALREFYETS